jgi:uroporphyrinogen decarboxylase
MSKAASPFSVAFKPDWEAFSSCLCRQGTPRRVHNIELFLDPEAQEAICTRAGIGMDLDPADPWFTQKRQIALSRWLGYDYVVAEIEGVEWTYNYDKAPDTAVHTRAEGREFMNEHRGPITSWEEFERYPWPDYSQATMRGLEWYQENLPDDMCIMGGGTSHFAESLNWLMGYETLCYALYEQPDLVRAIQAKAEETSRKELALYLQFDRVRFVWGSDDMGFRTGLLLGPDHTRRLVLSGHATITKLAHDAGRPYLLHSCGNLSDIYHDLADDVKIDGKHSFEDTIESVIDVKRAWGDRFAVLGGIDVDFLCRSTEKEIRARVRKTLDACMPGGGYCLGTGNTVANYVPLENYFAMLDEGRRYSA